MTMNVPRFGESQGDPSTARYSVSVDPERPAQYGLVVDKVGGRFARFRTLTDAEAIAEKLNAGVSLATGATLDRLLLWRSINDRELVSRTEEELTTYDCEHEWVGPWYGGGDDNHFCYHRPGHDLAHECRCGARDSSHMPVAADYEPGGPQ